MNLCLECWVDLADQESDTKASFQIHVYFTFSSFLSHICHFSFIFLAGVNTFEPQHPH